MGYRVKEYSLNELNRIAVPGTVTPALFWVLPVGSWRPGELDRMWHHFVERPNICNDYGLLLVKDEGRNRPNEPQIDLGPVGARLHDIVPAGTERFLSPSARLQDPSRLLVFSGGYPQPGWGVLVEGILDVHLFERMISTVNERLASDEQLGNELSVIAQAKECFRRWQHYQKQSPRGPDITVLEREMREGEKADSFLRDAQSALEKEDYPLAVTKLSEAVRVMQQAAGWLKISEPTVQLLSDNQKNLAAAVSILAVPADVLAAQVEPTLADLIAEPSKRQAAFKSLPTDELKDALKSCLFVRQRKIASDEDNERTWAQKTMADIPASLLVELAEIIRGIAKSLQEQRGVKAQAEHDYKVATEKWRSEGGPIRETLHQLMEQATQTQWNLGPRFLVAFEDLCREQQLWVRSIPWDPARMVGWKVMVRHVKLDVSDLRVAAQEFAPGTSIGILESDQQSGAVDGSYFTDYVHHIAFSRPAVSPRDVTRNLVARLLRPAEITGMIGLQGAKVPNGADSAELADLLLDAFGWREAKEKAEKPLASCIEKAGDGTLRLSGALSGNDVRITLESFCKDIIDLIIAHLGYDAHQLWDAIEERVPSFQSRNRRKDWADEVAHLTVGAAVMLLPGLGSLAFPMRSEVNKLASSLNSLSNFLNAASHHQEGASSAAAKLDDAANLIHEVLEAANGLLGELPWHLNASSVYGEQPKVISGEAWSHGSSTPRLLKVIVWTGEPVRRQVFLWNKTRRNPIITDPIFIERPGRNIPLES